MRGRAWLPIYLFKLLTDPGIGAVVGDDIAPDQQNLRGVLGHAGVDNEWPVAVVATRPAIQGLEQQ